MKKVNLVLWLPLLVWAVFFVFRQDEDFIWSLRIWLALLVYGALAFICLWRLIKTQSPAMLFMTLICAGAGYVLIKALILFSFALVWPKEIVPAAFLLLAIFSFWGGLVSHLKKEYGHGLLAETLFTLSAIMIMLFAGNYLLPKPMKDLDGMSISGFMVFCVIAIAGATAGRIFLNTGRTGLAKWIPSIVYRLVGIGGLFFCLVWANNVFYSGCYPDSPIGTSCHCWENKNIKPVLEKTSVVASADSLETGISRPSIDDGKRPESLSEITIPKGGSLCGTLGMTRQEALAFAKKNSMKYWTKKNILYVLIYPGEVFTKTSCGWQRK